MGRRSATPRGSKKRERVFVQAEDRVRKGFARRVRQLRLAEGKTLSEMADACRLSAVYLGVLELSKKSAGLSTIARLAEGLGVSPDELLRFDPPTDAHETPAERLGRRITAMAAHASEAQVEKIERLVKVYLEPEGAGGKK